MNRNVQSLPIAPDVRQKLFNAGFTSSKDFKHVDEEKLCREAGITISEAKDVLRQLLPSSSLSAGNDASTLLQKERDNNSILSFCERLDEALNGGIPLCRTTEICGLAGTGKTQFCLQLCVDVQIDKNLGGIGGEAIFIDTECSFSSARLKEIAKGAVDHCALIRGQEESSFSEGMTVEKILEHIYYYKCSSYLQLIAIVNQLPLFIQKYPRVRLVIIDSIAFHFRYGFDDNMLNRTKILNSLGNSLTKLAVQNSIAVVWTNQMTTKFDQNGQGYHVPALGTSWSHICSTRLLFHKERETRRVEIQKCPFSKQLSVPFQITVVGIRDVILEEQQSTSDYNAQQAAKRPRLSS